MIPIVMVVLGGQALGFLIGWACVFLVKQMVIDVDIGIDTVYPGIVLLVIGVMFLLGIANAADYQRWLNSWK